MSSGSWTPDRPSGRGRALSSINRSAYSGSYHLVAVVTKGRASPQRLTGTISLWLPNSPIWAIQSVQHCVYSASARSCDSVRPDTLVENFALVGIGDSAVATWPLIGTQGVAQRGEHQAGIEADIDSTNHMLSFSLGPGLRAEDGPPRFDVVEVVGTVLRGWWFEGIPVTEPNEGFFCAIQAPTAGGLTPLSRIESRGRS